MCLTTEEKAKLIEKVREICEDVGCFKANVHICGSDEEVMRCELIQKLLNNPIEWREEEEKP